MNTDTENFLLALLGVNDLGDAATVHRFAPAFVAAVDTFISSFRDYLESAEFDMDRLDYLERPFGCNVYFSLSGQGVGFFDEYDDPERTLGRDLQDHLDAFSGNHYRFEELECCLEWNDAEEIDLAFIPSALEEYRTKYFVTPWMTARA